LVFFFSSRRRHTRFSRDWSSDVCSSDLTDIFGMPVPQVDQMPAGMIDLYVTAMGVRRQGRTEFNDRERAVVEFSRYRNFLLGLRSEERRVGKEGRPPWGVHHGEQKTHGH